MLFLVFVLIFGLVGCSNPPETESELRRLGKYKLDSGNYKDAGKAYFQLWCEYPVNNISALLLAGKAYGLAGEYSKAVQVLDDYMHMQGESSSDVYLFKAAAYNQLVKTPMHNRDKAEKAMANLEMYKRLGHKSKKVKEIESFLVDVSVYMSMLEVYYALDSDPANFIYAMHMAQRTLKQYPNHKYSSVIRELYSYAAKSLGLQ